MSIIKDNLDNVVLNIKRICKNINKEYEDVTLIAVTKTIDTPRIKEVIDLGVKNIGENKVQEILDKYEELKDISNIHLIGHLQSNKVKYIIDKVKLIHSVDSISLMQEINKRAIQSEIIAKVLIQVNVAGEDTKFGIGADEVEDFLSKAESFKNIEIRGLMTMAPYYENPENARPVFRALKEIFDNISLVSYRNTKAEYLSMGMTNDYHIALEEGANMIRIGTGLFGDRVYNR